VRGEQLLDTERRCARICGAAFIEHGLDDVWEETYRLIQEGCDVQVGDARRFLASELEAQA